MAVLLLPAPASAADGPEFVSFSVVGAGPEWIFDSARDARVRAVVENGAATPSAAYTIGYEWVQGSSVTPMNGAVESSTDVGAALAAGAQREHPADWRLQQTQRGWGTLRATLSSGTTVLDTAETLVFVPVTDFELAAEDSATLHRDETAILDLAIHNHGNRQQGFTFATAGGDARLEASLHPASVLVPPGGVGFSSLLLHYTPDGSGGFATQYMVSVAPTTGEVGPDVESVSVTVVDTPGPGGAGVAVAGLAGGTSFVPLRGSGLVPFLVTNTGGTGATVELGAAVSPGWSIDAVLVAGNPMEGAVLGPGDAAQVDVRVSGPVDSVPGSLGAVTLTATAGSASHAATAPVRQSGPALEAQLARSGPTLYAREPVAWQVTVANVGNEAMAEATTFAWRLGLPAADPVIVETSVPVLAAGEAVQAALDAGIPMDGGAATVDLQWSGPYWMGPPVLGHWAEEVHWPSIEITVPEGLSGSAGEEIVYAQPPHVFRIRNNGTHTESFDVEALVARGAATVSPEGPLELDVFDTLTFTVRHRLPESFGGADAEPLQLVVTLAGHEHRWTALVETSIVDVHAPAVRFEAEPPIVGEPWPVRVFVDDDGLVTAVAGHVDFGSGARHPLNLTSAGDGAWHSETVLATAGEALFNLTATDAAGHVGTLSVPMRVYSMPPAALRLAPGTVLDPVAPGTALCLIVNAATVSVEAAVAGGAPAPLVVDQACTALVVAGGAGARLHVVVTARNGAGEPTTIEFDIGLAAAADSAVAGVDPDARRSTPGPGAVLVLWGVGLALRRLHRLRSAADPTV
jgi:hypothetical protein